MRTQLTVRLLGWFQIALGLLILAMAVSFLILYGQRLGSATTALGQATGAFAREVQITADTVEQNRQVTPEFIAAVGSYKGLTEQINNSSEKISSATAKLAEGAHAAAEACGQAADVVDRAGDKILILKYPSDLKLTYTRMLGVNVPTGIDPTLKPILKEEGEDVKGVARNIHRIEKSIKDSTEAIIPEVTKAQKALGDSCKTTVTLLDHVQAMAKEVDRRQLPESLAQMRQAGDALGNAGQHLTTIQPALYWGGGFVAAIGLLCVANGVLLLIVLPAGRQPSRENQSHMLAEAHV